MTRAQTDLLVTLALAVQRLAPPDDRRLIQKALYGLQTENEEALAREKMRAFQPDAGTLMRGGEPA